MSTKDAPLGTPVASTVTRSVTLSGPMVKVISRASVAGLGCRDNVGFVAGCRNSTFRSAVSTA